jgi:hypothetical protein
MSEIERVVSVDKFGNTRDGELLLSKEAVKELRKVMAWRGRVGLMQDSITAQEKAVERLAAAIFNTQNGLEFMQYT